nr:circularly permuted type 2 ATP-grasp protein [uncultured Desulfuromusa sp.]
MIIRQKGFYDELFDSQGIPRPGADLLIERINALPEAELQRRQKAAESSLLNLGITFNVYGNESQTEKIFPFDMVPRIIQAKEWQILEPGLKQRIKALNCFIDDVFITIRKFSRTKSSRQTWCCQPMVSANPVSD